MSFTGGFQRLTMGLRFKELILIINHDLKGLTSVSSSFPDLKDQIKSVTLETLSLN